MAKIFQISAHGKTFAVNVKFSPSASEAAKASDLATFIENFLRVSDEANVAAMAADINSEISMQTAEKMFAAMPQHLMMEFGVQS